RTVVRAVRCCLAREHDPVACGVGRFVQAQASLARLSEIVAEHLPDIDLPGTNASQARRWIRDTPNDHLFEARRLPPVVRHCLEAVKIPLFAFDVLKGASANGMLGSFVFTDALEILLGGDVLIAHKLRKV